jgi:hydrophobe/amphiphile efflux-3 (HAE3) family protein
MAIPEDLRTSQAGRFFWRVLSQPGVILMCTAVAIAVTGFFIPRLRKDTTLDAFIPRDHPDVKFHETVRESFGLSDPLFVLIVGRDPNGIFDPDALTAVKWLTDRIEQLPVMEPGRVRSLATTPQLAGTSDGIVMSRLLEPLPRSQVEVDRIRRLVMRSGIYPGRLVARDGRATGIVVHLPEDADRSQIYAQILALVDQAPAGADIHVAGEAAVQAYLGTYIDTDAARMYPLAAAAVTIILLLSYRTPGGILLPNVVVLGGITVALGAMAGADVPFYVITNALPVVLFAIGVSETLHILGRHYEELEHRPRASPRELAVRTMCGMWRPVLVTSIADVTGFLALGSTSPLPAVRAFGLFASLGAGAIMLFALFTVPSLLIVLPRRLVGTHTAGARHSRGGAVDSFGRAIAAVGRFIVRRPGAVLALGGATAGVAAFGALSVRVDENRIENFRRTEAIYKADEVINQTLSGSTEIDIVVSAPSSDTLLEPQQLQRIDALQRYLETLPHVRITTSIADVLKEVNRAFSEDRMDAYRLPDDPELTAQYLLFLSTTPEVVDVDEYIEDDHRLARIQVTLDSGRYTEVMPVLHAIDRQLRLTFNDPLLTATITGRPVIDDAWLRQLGPSTINGIVLALLSVWLMASIGLKSVVAGVFAIVPVSMAILANYAVMGFGGVSLGIGTSMFAAIAVGTAVNPAVHIIERLHVLMTQTDLDINQALATLFLTTGRALFFDCSAVAVGFGVLLTSTVPPLVWFGMLVTACVLTALVASVVLLPALIVVLEPAFLHPTRRGATALHVSE